MSHIHTINLSRVLKSYSNEWLALSHNQKKILGRGKNPKAAYKRAIAKGEKNPVLVRAPRDFGTYIL